MQYTDEFGDTLSTFNEDSVAGIATSNYRWYMSYRTIQDVVKAIGKHRHVVFNPEPHIEVSLRFEGSYCIYEAFYRESVHTGMKWYQRFLLPPEATRELLQFLNPLVQ